MRVVINILSTVALCSIVYADLPAQQKNKSNQVKTIVKSVESRLITRDGKVISISGEASFNLKMIEYDDTLYGELIYKLSNVSRQQIAQVTGKRLSKIPSSVTINLVSALPEKHAKCPNIRLEFDAFSYSLTISTDILIARFEPFTLDIKEGQQEIDKHLCKWLFWLDNGRVRTKGVIDEVNRLLANG